MVKAFGYGSGGHEVAQVLQFQQVDYLGVAYVDEGISLRNAGITMPILVLHTSEYEFERLLSAKLEPEIFSLSQLKKIISFTHERQEKLKIHLKLDTGMHRLGFLENETDAVIRLLHTSKWIKVASVFSHLAASEQPSEDSFTLRQINQFKNSSNKIEKGLGYGFTRHMVNSSGISRFPQAHFDMVRLGIGMYGISSSAKEQEQLVPVGTLQTVVSQTKILFPGETIGYGRTGKVKNSPKKIGIIPIGYADGFDRRLGNGNAHVFVNKKRVPTIGSICMDMCMIDLDGTDVQEGDKVEIFGANISVKIIANQMKTIPYEVLTNVSERVVRVFVS